jgi:Tol biopolymer transport system component
LVYDANGITGDTQLTWFDRTGRRLQTVGESAHEVHPQLSPDGKQVVVDRLDSQTGTYDLWLIELARGIPSRFTFDPRYDWYPVWSPDAARIIFSSDRDGVFNLYTKVASGVGKEELLLKSDQRKDPTDWSSDGRFLLFNQVDPKTGYDVWVLPDPGGGAGAKRPFPFVHTEFTERDGAFSPDGKWIAYTSNESGKEEIYVQAFPESGAKWQVSKGGGSRARWRRDGKELFYLASDRKIMAVGIGVDATFHAGLPEPLFESHINDQFARFTVTADGQRFLLPVPVNEGSSEPATVVLNWTKGIKP